MMEDGLFDRFPCEAVFALHNWPALPAGEMAVRVGPIMASTLRFEIRSEEHTSELQSQSNLVCRLLLEKKKNTTQYQSMTNLRSYDLIGKKNDWNSLTAKAQLTVSECKAKK